MMINYSKKYGLMTALSMLVWVNMPLNLAQGQQQEPLIVQEPLTLESVKPQIPNLKSQIIVEPQASRRASQCYDNGVC